MSAAASTGFACAACTFENTSGSACEMCGADRPAPAAEAQPPQEGKAAEEEAAAAEIPAMADNQNKQLYDLCHKARFTNGAIKKAIEGGIDVNWVSKKTNSTLFSYACARNPALTVEVLEAFKTAGADIHAPDDDGETPLHWSSNEDTPQHAQVVKWLVENNANLEATNGEGMTPLHLAAYQGSAHCAKMLIDLGANVAAKDRGGNTPAALARKEGHSNVHALFAKK